MAKNNFNYFIVKCVLLCGWLALFAGGVAHYSGSWLTYTIFSLVFLAVLISGFYRQVSYGYLFLVVMLWLGFWLKKTVHMLLGETYEPFGHTEPVGSFVGSGSAWDETLWVATAAGAGVLLARIFFARLAGQTNSISLQPTNAGIVPPWYPARRRLLWAVLAAILISLAIVNVKLNILQVGLSPGTILMWPLNAVIGWLISYGVALAVATLLWWDVALGRNVSLVVYFVLLEAVVATVSLLSRGAYIFHAVPQLFALYKNRRRVTGWSWKGVVVLGVSFAIFLVITNQLVNALRDSYYSNTPLSFMGLQVNSASSTTGTPEAPAVGSAVAPASEAASEAAPEAVSQAAPEAVSQAASEAASEAARRALVASMLERAAKFARFATDRWIGLEGVMAVSSYPHKGKELFFRGISERRELGSTTMYQEICASHYQTPSKFQFASLPGAAAFLYYTGSTWIVVLGMFALSLLTLGSETLIFKLTGNPLVVAIWGGIAANTVAQFGLAPVSSAPFFAMMMIGFIAIWLIQSKFLLRWLQNGYFRVKRNGA